MEFTEAQLIKALEGRDEGLRHRALYWFYYSSGIPDKARNVLRQLKAEEANLEDAVQEGIVALVKAIRRGSFRSESRLSTYFVSICRNIYLKKYRPRHVIADMDQLQAEPGYEAPDWKLMEEEQRGLLAALLKSALGKELLSFSIEEGIRGELRAVITKGPPAARRFRLQRYFPVIGAAASLLLIIGVFYFMYRGRANMGRPQHSFAKYCQASERAAGCSRKHSITSCLASWRQEQASGNTSRCLSKSWPIPTIHFIPEPGRSAQNYRHDGH